VATINAAHVVINPGTLREMHWNPYADEWSMSLSGKTQVTVFIVQATHTHNVVAGDITIAQLRALRREHRRRAHRDARGLQDAEVSLRRAPWAWRPTDPGMHRFEEFSLNQWLAVTPLHLVQAHLDVGEEFTKALDKGHIPIRNGHVPQDTAYAAQNASGKLSAKL